jgi:hypothetical protein
MARNLKKVLMIGVVGLVLHGVGFGAQILLESDFGKCPVRLDVQKTGKFKGVLPAGWGDNFTWWNKSQIESRMVTEKGKSFLRFTVTYIDPENNPQFSAGLAPLVDGGHYRLTMRARNASTGPLSLGLRMGPAPYTFRYEQQLSRSTEWVEKSWCFKLSCKAGDSLGLFLSPCGVGMVDVALIRLEKLTTPAQIAATFSRPDRATRNFFRNSRLPLGLQAGWSLGRMSDKATAEPDPKCIGPSGSPALRLASNGQRDSFMGTKGVRLSSEMFQVADPFVKNYVGLSVKGTGKWSFSVGGVTQEIELGGAWKRVTVEFMPDFAQKAYALDIFGNGTLWMDAFSAWAGNKDRPYESAGACEVALGLPASELAETRIQFEKEPAALIYQVTGDCKDGILKAKVANVYGREKNLPDLRLESSNTSGKINFGVMPETPYGQFRIEAWVERSGRRISPTNEMIVTRVKQPVFWNKDAPESPFGCHFLSVDRTIKIMKAGGVNWARLHDAGIEYIGWWYLEPEKGKWTFHDEDIQRYRNHQIKIFGQFGTAPTWASYLSKLKDRPEKPEFGDIYTSRYFPPLNLADFANYVRKVTAHYQGVIDEYFVWNEPYYTGWWPVGYDKTKKEYFTSKNPQADFAALMKAAYTAAKSVDPTIKVSGFNTAGWEIGTAWTKGVYDAGAFPYCDLIDYHFYTCAPQGFVGSHTDPTYEGAVGYIRQKEGRLDKPVYMSEGLGRAGTANIHQGSTEPAPNTGIYKNALPYGPNEDYVATADRVCKFVLNLLAKDVKKVFLYSAHCYGVLGEPSEFNVLLCGDGYPHPSLAAHANLAQHLEGRKFFKAVQVAEGAYAYIFGGKDRSVAVISGRPGCQVYPLPDVKELKVSDLFGNPLPLRSEYTGTLMFAEAATTPEAMEKLFTGH